MTNICIESYPIIQYDSIDLQWTQNVFCTLSKQCTYVSFHENRAPPRFQITHTDPFDFEI